MVSVDVCCPQCKAEFEIDDVSCSSLRDAIEDAADEAASDARAEAESSGYDFEPIDALDGHGRMLGDLACAIRAGDRTEAELLLDRIADLLGGDAQHQVSLGRYRIKPSFAVAA